MRLQCNYIQALYVECVRKEGGKINMRAGEGEEASRFKIFSMIPTRKYKLVLSSSAEGHQ